MLWLVYFEIQWFTLFFDQLQWVFPQFCFRLNVVLWLWGWSCHLCSLWNPHDAEGEWETSGEQFHSRRTTTHAEQVWHVLVTSHSRKQVQCRAAGSDLPYLVSQRFVVALFIATGSTYPRIYPDVSVVDILVYTHYYVVRSFLRRVDIFSTFFKWEDWLLNTSNLRFVIHRSLIRRMYAKLKKVLFWENLRIDTSMAHHDWY